MLLTKGFMCKALKEKGIRKADKYDGSYVSLEHLKTFEVTKLYYKYCVNE